MTSDYAKEEKQLCWHTENVRAVKNTFRLATVYSHSNESGYPKGWSWTLGTRLDLSLPRWCVNDRLLGSGQRTQTDSQSLPMGCHQ